MATATATTTPTTRWYSNYWEDDSTANPKIVRVLHKSKQREYFDVILPDGEQRQVHMHTLGKMHKQ